MSTEIATIETVQQEQPEFAPVLTLGKLGLRNFIGEGDEMQSTKTKCPPAATITMADYLTSKSPFDTSRSRLVPLSPFQIIEDVSLLAGANEKAWSAVHVYRDHIRLDGYVEKHTKHSKGRIPLVTPNVPLTEMVFERIIAVMDLAPGENGMTYKMALKYQPNLLEVAIGVNVTVCQNWNIFGGKHFAVTSNFTFDAMMMHLVDLFGRKEDLWKEDMKTVDKLMLRDISRQEIHEIIGDLSMRYHTGLPVLQLSNISDLGREIANREREAEMKTYWDFTNAGTQHLKFDQDSGDATLDIIGNFSSYMAEKVLLN